MMKQRVLHAAFPLEIYKRAINAHNIMQDCVEALCQLNDNDIHDAFRYKQKKARQFNACELADTYVSNSLHQFEILNIQTGVVSSDTDMIS